MPINEQELLTKMLDLESDSVERTISVDKSEKFAEAICAFANDMPNHRQPGYLIVGVDDNGNLSGLKVSDMLLKTLGDFRSAGNILPQPALMVSKWVFADGEVAVVEVHPSDLPPVRFKGRICIRVGPRRAYANEQEERILSERRVALARSFDARPCFETTKDDLALGQFDVYRQSAVDAETIANNHRPIELQLASLRLYDSKAACLTYAGVLLFAKNPRFYLPGAYVQFLRFPGEVVTDIPLDQAEISGDLISVMRELEVRTKVLIHTRMQAVTGFEEKLLPDYPEWALRELLMNAVMHRNYDSNTPIHYYEFQHHIEIHSPGGLYGEVSKENFGTQSSYRNPVIAEAMKSLGFVNRFGYGVQRAQALLASNGNPPAQFEFDKDSVLVKIYKSRA